MIQYWEILIILPLGKALGYLSQLPTKLQKLSQKQTSSNTIRHTSLLLAPVALDSLNGRMPPDIETLMPETINLLPVLAQPHPSLVKSHPTITPEEFINLYRALPKDTSMSPSRRHIGHYKATLKYPQLIFLHTTMMSLPFQCGVIPVRWTRVTDTDIMLEKESGNP
jgi:hypothetical protein